MHFEMKMLKKPLMASHEQVNSGPGKPRAKPARV